MNNRAGFSGLIAKGGFGEAGMLTQQDIERIKKLLPTSSSTAEEAPLAFKEINEILSSARVRFETAKSKYTGVQESYKPIKTTQNNDVSNKIEQARVAGYSDAEIQAYLQGK